MARRGLSQVLDAATAVARCGAVGLVRDAEYLPAATAVDLVLVGADVFDLEDGDGIGRLLTRFGHARVVVLVADDAPARLVALLCQGADGVVPRAIEPAALVRALCGVARGEVALPRSWLGRVVEALRLGAPVAGDDRLAALSAREREVLAELLRGRSNAAIARRLGLKESTVKTHVSSILHKTGSRSRFALSASASPASASA